LPQKEKVINFLRRIKEVLSNNKTAGFLAKLSQKSPQESIIHMLNPMLQGFGMYYRFAVSKKTFSTIVWEKLWRWAKRRHPKKTKKWIMRKYFTTTTPKWVFISETGKKINIMPRIPIVRFVMIKSGGCPLGASTCRRQRNQRIGERLSLSPGKNEFIPTL